MFGGAKGKHAAPKEAKPSVQASNGTQRAKKVPAPKSDVKCGVEPTATGPNTNLPK